MKYCIVTCYDLETGDMVLVHVVDETKINKLVERKIISQPYLQFTFDEDDPQPFCEEDMHERFIDAWQFDDDSNPTKLVVNIEKAKAIWMRELRRERDDRLAYWDEQMIMALGTQDSTRVAYIEDIKNQLRDLPERINLDLVESVRDFIDMTPAVLELQ